MEKAVNYILKAKAQLFPARVIPSGKREGIARVYDEPVPENRLW